MAQLEWIGPVRNLTGGVLESLRLQLVAYHGGVEYSRGTRQTFTLDDGEMHHRFATVNIDGIESRGDGVVTAVLEATQGGTHSPTGDSFLWAAEESAVGQVSGGQLIWDVPTDRGPAQIVGRTEHPRLQVWSTRSFTFEWRVWNPGSERTNRISTQIWVDGQLEYASSTYEIAGGDTRNQQETIGPYPVGTRQVDIIYWDTEAEVEMMHYTAFIEID